MSGRQEVRSVKGGAADLRDNCVQLGGDIFGKGDRGVMQMLYAK